VVLTSAKSDDQKYVTQSIRPAELEKLVKEGMLTEENVLLVRAKTSDQEYITQYVRPKELERITNEIQKIISDISLTDSQKLKIDAEIDLANEQVKKMIADTDLTVARKLDQEYITANIRPQELDKMIEEVKRMTAEVALTEAKTDDQVYVTTYVRPKELELRQAEIDLRAKEIEIKEKQSLVLDEDIKLKIAQEAYTRRQIEGFDDNVRQKMLDAQMNAWAMMFSSGLLEEKPRMICDDAVTNLYKFMSDNSGVPYNPTDCPPSTGRANENRRSR
jgi:hypothetical protein